MRTLVSVAVMALNASILSAQQESARSGASGIAFGVVAAPALEGGGPWFLPAVRVSVPLGSDHGLDLEAGRIFGKTNAYAEIEQFIAGQLRFNRKRTAVGAAQYWLLGLRYLDMWKFSGGRGYLLYVNVGLQWEPWAGDGTR